LKTVIGVLLNFKDVWDRYESRMHQEPHNQPPRFPVLFIKPCNTWRNPGDFIILPSGVDELEIGGTLGVVIGKTASHIQEANAYTYIKGYLIANDVTIPHESILRPPIKQKCRDSFCPMSAVTLSPNIQGDGVFNIGIFVNDELKLQASTTSLVRSIPKLLADISEYMTLKEDDVVLIGTPDGAPIAKKGDKVTVEVDCSGVSLGRLTNFIESEVSI